MFVVQMEIKKKSVKTGDLLAGFIRHLENEKNEEITERLVKEISEQIEVCLTKMAEVVEIPLA